MDATEKTSDITIASETYQLTRFNPRDGSWILGKLLPYISGPILAPDSKAPKVDARVLGLMIAQSFSSLSEVDYSTVQFKAMAAVRKYVDVNGLPQPHPVMMIDGPKRGQWAILPEPDLVTYTSLTIASLAFNLLPFFAPGALETLMLVFPDLNQLSAESTDTSSGQLPQVSGSTTK
jgi:hypothetical protein